MSDKTSVWRNRIVGYGEEAPGQLLANPRNWRIHPKHQQDALAGVLDEIGWVQDVLVNKATGYVVDGHLRVAMAISRGEPTVPVKYVDLTEEEEAKVIATLDPIGALAVAGVGVLADLLAEVETENEAVQKLLDGIAAEAGIVLGDEPPEDSGARISEADALAEKWGTALGQVWELGSHRLAIGDCRDRTVVEGVMRGEKAGAVVTDPPYGYDKGMAGDGDISEALLIVRDALDIAHSTCVADCWAVIDTPKKYIREFLNELGQLWQVREPVLVMYRNSMLNGCYGTNIFELVWVYAKGRPKVNRNINGVDIIKQGGTERNIHPTQKFVDASEHFLRMFSNETAIVFDPFVGSGTTIIACERLGRQCRAIEIDPGYCAVAIQRWVDITGREPKLLNE